MKIYVRIGDYPYNGQDLHFVTLDREKAFLVDDSGADSWLFDQDQKLWVYENEKIVEAYYWGGIKGWLPAPYDLDN